MPSFFADGGASVVLDERYLPLVITRWRGASTVALVDDYFDTYARLMRTVHRSGGRVVSVSDVLHAERPDAVVRKAISVRIDRIEAECPGVMLYPSYLAMEGAVLRGTITAINWISNSVLDIQAFPTVRAALDAGLARVERESLRRPDGLDARTYFIPEPATLSA